MILDEDQRQLLFDAINDTWQAIGSDCEQAWRSAKHRPTNLEAIEACIDANHMATYAEHGKAAEVLVTEMVRDAGYAPTLRYLARHISLA